MSGIFPFLIPTDLPLNVAPPLLSRWKLKHLDANAYNSLTGSSANLSLHVYSTIARHEQDK